MQETRALFDDLRIGLLGGSFNPPHEGHRQISLIGLKKMNLDYVWWLVTPGNPQKKLADYADFSSRMAAAKACADHPRIIISDFEQRHGLTYTAHTIQTLKTKFPKTRFVWMMGADNLAGFHTWRDWRLIADNLPIAVFNRPGHRVACLQSPAAQTLEHYRLPVTSINRLPDLKAPAWIYYSNVMNTQSSTSIRRQNRDWITSLTKT